MVKVAVDVVLLPSDDIMDVAIDANKRLQQHSTDKIVLNKVNCLPHISLAMGVINEDRIVEIGEVLRAIVHQIPLRVLIATGIHVQVISSGRTVSAFQIENTRQLQLIHEKVMQKLEPFFSYVVTEDMIHPPEVTDEATLQWIKNYPENSGFKKFFPHITIGFGRLYGLSFPIRFTVSKIAICHMGNHCTCRKILSSVEFGD
jgi:2'-5' RNA ligase